MDVGQLSVGGLGTWVLDGGCWALGDRQRLRGACKTSFVGSASAVFRSQYSEFRIVTISQATCSIILTPDSCILTSLLQTPRRGFCKSPLRQGLGQRWESGGRLRAPRLRAPRYAVAREYGRRRRMNTIACMVHRNLYYRHALAKRKVCLV